jgi:hypothetical protein
MHNLNPVTLNQNCLAPFVAPGHFLIEFDGDPRRGQGQFADQIIQG